MSCETYLAELTRRLERLAATQVTAIRRAAGLAADTIAAGGLVHLFGTGHGSIPALEAFPRTGSFVGWNPIVVDALGPCLRVGGDGSVHQFRYLQAAAGFGKVILESFPVRAGDAFVVFSHSGVNPVVVEVALEVRDRGLPLVAVTSLEHSQKSISRHPSGKRLFEVANVVIDTGAPFGDAVVEVPGLAQPVAAVSTSLAAAVTNSLVAETARLLAERGVPVLVLGHIDRHGRAIPDEMRRDYVKAYQDRLWRR